MIFEDFRGMFALNKHIGGKNTSNTRFHTISCVGYEKEAFVQDFRQDCASGNVTKKLLCQPACLKNWKQKDVKTNQVSCDNSFKYGSGSSGYPSLSLGIFVKGHRAISYLYFALPFSTVHFWTTFLYSSLLLTAFLGSTLLYCFWPILLWISSRQVAFDCMYHWFHLISPECGMNRFHTFPRFLRSTVAPTTSQFLCCCACTTFRRSAWNPGPWFPCNIM